MILMPCVVMSAERSVFAYLSVRTVFRDSDETDDADDGILLMFSLFHAQCVTIKLFIRVVVKYD